MAEVKPIEAEHLLALDATLGYLGRKITATYENRKTELFEQLPEDQKERERAFLNGYSQAHSDIAHIRHIVWYDWHKRDPQAASAYKIDWEAIKATPHLGKDRIFPKED